MIHQPLGGTKGQASDIEVVAQRIGLTKNHLSSIHADKTGQTIRKIAYDCDYDYTFWRKMKWNIVRLIKLWKRIYK